MCDYLNSKAQLVWMTQFMTLQIALHLFVRLASFIGPHYGEKVEFSSGTECNETVSFFPLAGAGKGHDGSP